MDGRCGEVTGQKCSRHNVSSATANWHRVAAYSCPNATSSPSVQPGWNGWLPYLLSKVVRYPRGNMATRGAAVHRDGERF